MQEYACGFLFSVDRERVLLIRKRRPAWQAGKLNGIGGKIEPGETALDAMRREFHEEAGLHVADWQHVLTLRGDDWAGHFFRAFGDIDAAWAVTDELVERYPLAALPKDTIPNLQWMIPMLLDEDVASKSYRVEVLNAAI
jgi:8-oxo-dGTP diphosphatase